MRAQEGVYGLPTGFGRVQTAGSVVAFSGARFYLQCTMYKVLFRSYLLLYILPNEVYQIVSAKIQHLYLCTKFRKKNLQKLRIEGGASIVTTPLPLCEGRAPNAVRDPNMVPELANNCNYSPCGGEGGSPLPTGEGGGRGRWLLVLKRIKFYLNIFKSLLR